MVMGLCFNGLLASSIFNTMSRALQIITPKPVSKQAGTHAFSRNGKGLATVDISSSVHPPQPLVMTAQLNHLRQPLYTKVEHLAVNIGRTYGLNLAVQLLVHGMLAVAMACYLTDVALVQMDGTRASMMNILMLLLHLTVAYRVLSAAEGLTEAVTISLFLRLMPDLETFIVNGFVVAADHMVYLMLSF